MPSGGVRFLFHAPRSREYRGFLRGVASYLAHGALIDRDGHLPPAGHRVPATFAGICVATAADPESDQYVLARLRDLRIRNVRLDYGYTSPGTSTDRLLAALSGSGYVVQLHLVQPAHEAAAMESAAAQSRWRSFLNETLDKVDRRIDSVEIGSTVNRRRWAGYTLRGFMHAWDIAYDVVHARGLTLTGPNVTDYEPFYSSGLLRLFRDRRQSPDVYTNNLFVERAIEPEAYDDRLLGRVLAPWAKYNLVKKSRQLARITRAEGVHRLWNSYVSWTFPRINRILPDAEKKQADYLARYMILAATTGAFERVYWGPLISSREGLIDDPAGYDPKKELVTWYASVHGPAGRYRQRPGFAALRTFIALLPGSTYEGSFGVGALEIHSFATETHRIHAVWTRNARAADLTRMYSADVLAAAEYVTLDGTIPDERPYVVSESPLYLRWPIGLTVQAAATAAAIPRLSINHRDPGGSYHRFDDGYWRGMVLADSRAHAELLWRELHPERIRTVPRVTTLRDARNSIWTIEDPRAAGHTLAVKQPVRLRLYKKIIERFRPTKALRSWNGACELLRRGIDTPAPVAYFERAGGVGLTDNWYICNYRPDALSVRQFFTTYAKGEPVCEGFTLDQFIDQLIPFLRDLHDRGVYFRDLSSGNILVHATGGELEFTLIDTARARFYSRKVNILQRLSDLKRTCHKLHWEGRMQFMAAYLAAGGRCFSLPYRLPLYLYDIKTTLKRALRRRRI